MADFTNTGTANNPQDWFTSAYNFSNNLITLSLAQAQTDTGVSNTDLHETTGDARSVYLAVAEALFDAYDAKDDSADTTSGRLKMTKSQAVQNVAGTTTADIRYTTYTIHVQEHGEASGGTSFTAPSFTSTGVRAE
tara:strand:+ start:73 stop:480 length:408 start_codon:yes stop_codon:yes gene_type:complete